MAEREIVRQEKRGRGMDVVKETADADTGGKPFGIYVHIPFCRQKCFYCDFPSFAGREKKIDAYLTALDWEFFLVRAKILDGASPASILHCRETVCHEMRQLQGEPPVSGSHWRGSLHHEMGQLQEAPSARLDRLQPATVYIGGGTPTVLSLAQLTKLFYILHRHIDFTKAVEFTVEMNPGTVDEEKLAILRDSGVNRLSIGVQSFHDECLQAIGRIHNGDQAREIVELAQAMGFGNISIDLMYGLPKQDLGILQESVTEALGLKVQHISIYGLQLEDGTVFAKLQELGKLELPEEDETAAMYEYMTKALPETGYQRYEISNFALHGFHSRHNMAYWQDVPYLGFGSGAHGYWECCRYGKTADIDAYMEEVRQGHVMETVEEQADEQTHMEEFCFLALRTAQGISQSRFQETFHQPIQAVYGEKIRKLQSEGLLITEGDFIHLTNQGMQYGNMVFEEFLL